MRNSQYLLYFNSTIYRNFQSQDTSSRSSQIASDDGQLRLFEEPLVRLISDAVDRTIATGASIFRREIMLPRLIPVGPEEIADSSIAGRWHIVRRLAKALRGERTRGRAGHWTYSLNRHIGLLQAFKAERAALRRLHPVTINSPRVVHLTTVG